MSIKVVISQSMLFPWVGMLEQLRLADIFVHYDDVQFSKGGFVNRVQVKTARGVEWMTVPLDDLHLGQRIDEVRFASPSTWRQQHLDLLQRSLDGAPWCADALELAREVYAGDYPSIGALSRASMLALADYFGLRVGRTFVDVTDLQIGGASSDRVLAVVKQQGADTYVTGHGASRYLDHLAFEREGIRVEYMNYRRLPYPQLHGAFTPHVTGLDLVANCGRAGIQYICSETVPWRAFCSPGAV